MSGSSRRRNVVRVSSGDVPLIALPNVTRLKIEGPINTCLAAATQPMTCDAMRCSQARIITRQLVFRRDWKIQVHLQLREKFSANLTQWPLVPSQEINSYELYSSQWHTHIQYFPQRHSWHLRQTAAYLFCLIASDLLWIYHSQHRLEGSGVVRYVFLEDLVCSYLQSTIAAYSVSFVFSVIPLNIRGYCVCCVGSFNTTGASECKYNGQKDWVT